MLKRLLVYVLLLVAFGLSAQNLVPNSNFEEYYKSNDGSKIYGIGDSNKYNCLYNWFNINGSVDLYCSQNTSYTVNGCMGGGERWAIPPTIFGEIYPRLDSSFIGLITWTTSLQNAFTAYAYSSREWAGVRLVSPLKRDQCYTFTMYVARAAKTGYNVSSLGAYFTADSLQSFIDDTTGLYITPMPFDKDSIQVLQDPAVPIWDTTWVPITGIFRAKGGEQYMYIGNLIKDGQYQLLPNGTYADSMYCKGSYFFIDDVSLYEVEGTCTVGLHEQKKTTLKIYPNPATNSVIIDMPTGYPNPQLYIYNLTGQLVATKPVQPNQPVPITELNAGMYIFAIHSNNTLIGREKVVVY